MGYPLLHDVTDLLRIGDVTFIKPGEPAITAEVKTRVVSSRPSETGTVYEYRIELILGDEIVPARMRSDSPPSGEAPRNPQPDAARRRSRINARTGRQLQRLRRAHKIKVAEHGALI